MGMMVSWMDMFTTNMLDLFLTLGWEIQFVSTPWTTAEDSLRFLTCDTKRQFIRLITFLLFTINERTLVKQCYTSNCTVLQYHTWKFISVWRISSRSTCTYSEHDTITASITSWDHKSLTLKLNRLILKALLKSAETLHASARPRCSVTLRSVAHVNSETFSSNTRKIRNGEQGYFLDFGPVTF